MKAELRADGLHISGYVNVTCRQSRPVMTPHGKAIEVIEQRAFQRAIGRATEGIRMLLDHNPGRVLALTKDKTLSVWEDEIGLRAEAVVTDEEVIAGAKAGKLRGWSFDMRNVVDTLEKREEGLPIRHVKDFDMSEITLAMHRRPVYSATSVEVRAEGETEVEERAVDSGIELVLPREETKKYDNTAYMDRLNNLKK